MSVEIKNLIDDLQQAADLIDSMGEISLWIKLSVEQKSLFANKIYLNLFRVIRSGKLSTTQLHELYVVSNEMQSFVHDKNYNNLVSDSYLRNMIVSLKKLL